jgi:methylated-DNA-[protein]-cysteine S-methyltransferase
LKIPGALIRPIVKSDAVRAELTRYSVPGWGAGELWVTGDLVVAHEFHFGTDAGPRSDEAGADAEVRAPGDDLVGRFTAFLGGHDDDFHDVALDLDWATPFQHAVATALRSVPRGEVVSYGELAALAGYSGAARAAGTFCARNRFMLILPCHRVVGAAGIGGYGSAGPRTKRRLLALEGVVL